MLTSIIIIKSSLFDLLLFFLFHCLFDIFLISWRKVNLMLQIIVLLLQKSSICLFNCMELVEDIQWMLQWNGSMESFHYINHSSFSPSDPISKFHVIRYRSWQHNNSNMFRQHDNSFLPYNTSLFIIYVMNLIENNPLYIPNHLRSSVKIITQNFCGHNDTRCLLI